ncbi:MAG: lipopolysaccharide heptosyltransferase II [Pyrinomonadaceae bacterium]
MKILVRGTNWIGDAVMSIPALRELRRIFPDARITLHIRSSVEGLFSDAAFIDELVTFEKNRWTIRDVYYNSHFLRSDGYDLAVLLPNSFEAALTSFLTRVPRRIGYNKDVRGLLLTDPIAVPEWKNRKHEVFYYVNLVAETERRLLGRDTVSSAFPDTTLEISCERKLEARKQLANYGIDPGKKTIALGVGSTNSRAKRWPAEYFARLSDRLHTEMNANAILVGSKQDRSVAGEVVGQSRKPPIDLTGKTDLSEIVAILSEVDLLISNDMGLAHVAPSVGTKTIAIFGPTNPETTRPFSENARIITKEVECSPCMLRDCPIDHRCMIWISVDEVFEATERIFNAKPQSGEDAKEENTSLIHK